MNVLTFIYERYYAILDKYFTKQLKKNSKLLRYLLESPQAFTIPAANYKRGLVIWLILKPDINITVKCVHDMLTIVVNEIKSKIRFKGLIGIEIVLGFRLENQEIDRILRASLWAGHYSKYEQINPLDILNEKPCEGIQFGWYWDREKIPAQ